MSTTTPAHGTQEAPKQAMAEVVRGKPIHWKTREKLAKDAAAAAGGSVASVPVPAPAPVVVAASLPTPDPAPLPFAWKVETPKEKAFPRNTHNLAITLPGGVCRVFCLDQEPSREEIARLANSV
jgi:hypothetical protein